MESYGAVTEWILGAILVLSALGVILIRQPVHASLFFLLTLLTLAALYLQLNASFIAIMQILVYAGAILVLFMFVMVLFQDAHEQMRHFKSQSSPFLIIIASTAFLVGILFFSTFLAEMASTHEKLPAGYGTVQALGRALYLDYFFPFEAIILLFLVAVVGSLYIAKKVNK